ncbi:hypothetical protein ACPZ19_37410 [Amycolatopsis lurida]
MTPPPRRGEIRRVAGDSGRRVLVYSGNMFNDLPDVPYVITMEITSVPEPMDVALADGSRVAYTGSTTCRSRCSATGSARCRTR